MSHGCVYPAPPNTTVPPGAVFTPRILGWVSEGRGCPGGDGCESCARLPPAAVTFLLSVPLGPHKPADGEILLTLPFTRQCVPAPFAPGRRRPCLWVRAGSYPSSELRQRHTRWWRCRSLARPLLFKGGNRGSLPCLPSLTQCAGGNVPTLHWLSTGNARLQGKLI